VRPGFFASRVSAKDSSSFVGALMPAFHWIIITYVVFVLFGFYLLYMYEPVTTHYVFSRIFNPFI
jgi:hypothetical protein